jgi:hypothetical protein
MEGYLLRWSGSATRSNVRFSASYCRESRDRGRNISIDRPCPLYAANRALQSQTRVPFSVDVVSSGALEEELRYAHRSCRVRRQSNRGVT